MLQPENSWPVQPFHGTPPKGGWTPFTLPAYPSPEHIPLMTMPWDSPRQSLILLQHPFRPEACQSAPGRLGKSYRADSSSLLSIFVWLCFVELMFHFAVHLVESGSVHSRSIKVPSVPQDCANHSQECPTRSLGMSRNSEPCFRNTFPAVCEGLMPTPSAPKSEIL